MIAEIKLLTWAADKLFDLADLDQIRSDACRKRVADYFGSIADCLTRIATHLLKNEIPTKDGNTLKELFDGFELVLASNFC